MQAGAVTRLHCGLGLLLRISHSWTSRRRPPSKSTSSPVQGAHLSTGTFCRIVFPVYLWRRTAELHWIKAHEDLLQAHADGQLVIVRRPGRKRLELEIVCRSRSDSSRLVEEFGGRVDALPRNWLERFTRVDFKPIKIGKRLTIVRSINELQRCGVRCPQRNSEHYAR